MDKRSSKNNFYKTITLWNKSLKGNNNKLSREDLKLFISIINSYLGIMKHYDTYKLRKKMLLQNLSAYFWNYVYPVGYTKLVLKRRIVKKSLSNGVNISGGYCKLVPKIKIIKN